MGDGSSSRPHLGLQQLDAQQARAFMRDPRNASTIYVIEVGPNGELKSFERVRLGVGKSWVELEKEAREKDIKWMSGKKKMLCVFLYTAKEGRLMRVSGWFPIFPDGWVVLGGGRSLDYRKNILLAR